MTKTRRELILDELEDLTVAFIFDDRVGDLELGVHAIPDAIAAGEISLEEMVSAFRQHLVEGLK